MAKEPDYSKMYPRRFITMSMQDKYMAVCFIYDGIQYQDLCKEENPDGTFNYSEKCLSRLPYRLPGLGPALEQQASLNNSEKGLVPYSTKTNQDNFPNILDALQHYWLQVVILCMLSALIFHFGVIALNKFRHNKYVKKFNYLTRGMFLRPDLYEDGVLLYDKKGMSRIGKISFDEKIILGQGNRGTFVFKGQFEDNQNCAVKRVMTQNISIAERETDFLRSLQHDNLVRYLATEADRNFVYIALELAEYTLSHLVESKRISETELTNVELCRQSALGLQYLHKLNIVHRDIKPQNILISFPMRQNNQRKVMISDFGISKQLSNIDTGHTSNALRYFDGTQGWMAPEICRAKLMEDKSLSVSKEADIFSLGCVFYYILSNGQHPFGQVSERQANVLNNKNLFANFITDDKLFDLTEDASGLAKALIKSMINSRPEDRPPISSILMYPIFWTNATKLQFLQEVSDRIEKLNFKDEIVRRINNGGKAIFSNDWERYLCEYMKEDLIKNKTRQYKKHNVSDLLRLIRNKKHHYRELPDSLKQNLGEVPNGFMNYFNLRYPDLLPHVYEAMQICKDESVFQAYYEQMNNFVFAEIVYDRQQTYTY